jgi:hypothetical protein
MMERKGILHLAIAAAALLALAALTSAAAGPRASSPQMATDMPGMIRILPQPAFVGVGGTVTVDVWLENVGNIYGLDFKLNFEKAEVSIPSGKVTPLWEVFDEDNQFTISNKVISVDGAYNQLQYALTNVNPAEPFTGTGRVCSITFSGLAEGTTALDFTYAKGSTQDGDPLYPVQVDGIIVIGSMNRLRLPVVAVQ